MKIERPYSVGEYENIIKRKIPYISKDSKEYVITKNIAYNIQYLDMLNQIHANKNTVISLHSVYITLNIKTFIITTTSIIEAILFYELRKLGETNSELKLIANFSNQVSDIIIKSSVYKKLTQANKQEREIDLNQMITIAQEKKIFGDNSEIYGLINILRKLRNRIHLYLGEKATDTDRFKFYNKDLQLAKKSLYKIFELYFNISKTELQKFFGFLIIEE